MKFRAYLAQAISLAAVALLAAPAQADNLAQGEPAPVLTDDMRDAFDRGCGDDNGVDRCDADIQAKMLALYGWEGAQDLLAKGVQFRRFMMVDGYGRDVLGLTMEQRSGSAPRVFIDVPKRNERSMRSHPDTPLTADLSETQWQEVLTVTQQLEAEPKSLMSVDEDGNEVINICLHSWFTVVEAGDPQEEEKPSNSRLKPEGACAGGPAMAASFALAEIAYDALPECHALDQERFRNIVMLLNTCRQLGGDRMAASEARGVADRLEDALYDEDSQALEALFVQGKKQLAAQFLTNIKDATLYLEPPFADGTNATVMGLFVLNDQSDDDSGSYLAGEIELDLVRGSEGWQIANYTMHEPTNRKYQ
jgi:hypothetical protein